MDFAKLATEEQIQETKSSLEQNGIAVIIVENKEQAKKKVFELIPEGSEVMDMTSVTLAETGIADELSNSGKYNAVKGKLYSLDKATHEKEMNVIGATSDYTVGSVHAVTEDGRVVIASNTGSQLPAYVYASANVIWVVGVQKIVKNLDEAMMRINEYVLPLESDRAHKAYGVGGSNVSKVLIINKEVNQGRITLIFVKEKVGF